MTATANGTGQQFSNVILSSYTASTDMTVFLNGILLENNSYTLSGGTLTVNEYVNTGDNIDVITQFAVGNVLNITSGYGDSNVAAYLPTYSGNLNASYITSNGMTIDGNVIITGNANVQGNLTYNNITNLTTSNLVLGLGNNQTGINVTGGGIVVGNTAEAALLYNFATQSWVSNIAITSNANVNGTNVNASGAVVAGGNIVTTANVAGNYFIGNGSLLTGITGLATLAGNLSGNLLANGFFVNNLTELTVAGNISGNTNGFAIGYRDIPQVVLSGNAVLSQSDAGKHYYSTLATVNTITIPNNSTVAWTVGTTITIVNRGTGNITLAAQSPVSLYLAGNSTAANRTLTTYGMASIMNVGANVWMINGTGIV
jgi:hypothetical protein